jgi:hypothetical protein
MSSRTVNVLTAVFLLGLLAAVPLTAPRWARYFRQPLPVLDDERSSPPSPPEKSPAAAVEATRTINVKLLFQAPDRPGLVIEERTVAFSADLPGQIRAVVEELVRGSTGDLVPTLDPATKVLDVFLTAGGVAYVDLSKDATSGHGGGSDEELLAVYSVVDTITSNFPSVRRVQILIDDRPAETLAGHVDLSRPLPPDMTLLAESLLSPVASPGETAPAPSPSPRS